MSYSIALLIYDGVDLRHLSHMYTICGQAASDAGPAFSLHTVARTKSLLTCAGGLQVMPDHIYPDAHIYDLLFVPGGPGVAEAARQLRLMDWINRASRLAQVVAGADNGSLLLAAARLLSGQEVAYQAELAESYPDVTLVEGTAVVHHGKIMTAAGHSPALAQAIADHFYP